jgi:amidophosphoribosyltransferase
MCGVFGIFGHPEAAKLTYLGLHTLQHRGQESAGIVATSPGESFERHRGRGLVTEVFSPSNMAKLSGNIAIGHVRYSTAGGTNAHNTQPLAVETFRGPIAVAHNGNLVNANDLRKNLESDGAIFSSRGDTEAFVHLMARSRAPRIEDRIREAVAQVEGAYTLLILHEGGLIGLRDPHGFRPLIIGRLGDAYILCSETCALNLIGATFVREVERGEMVSISEHGIRSEPIVHAPDAPSRRCIFELVYFARPDSEVFSHDVYTTRYTMGRQLAEEAPAAADLVIPVPDSGVPAALGFAEAAGLPFRHGLLRSHYVGRTFIQPEQNIRNFGVRLKLSAVRAVLRDKRVVVVDDSLVRGTTSRKIVEMLRQAGAKEIHVRISSPPTTFPCFYGIDTPNRNELIAARHSVDAIRSFLGADTLAYLSEDGLHAAVNDSGPKKTFCNACFTGKYSAGKQYIESRLPVVQRSDLPPRNELIPVLSEIPN